MSHTTNLLSYMRAAGLAGICHADAEAMERLRRWSEGDDNALNVENPDAR